RGREPFNVLEEMRNTYVDVEARDLQGYVTANFDIAKDLRMTNLASIRKTYNHRDEVVREESNLLAVLRNQEETYYNPPDDRYNTAFSTLPFGGVLRYVDNEGSFLVSRNSLAYKPTIGKHDLEAIFGNEMLQNVYDTYRTTGYGIGFDRLNTVSTDILTLQAFPGDYFSFNNRLERSFSLYGVLGYGYANKYIVSMQARNDVSNSYGQSRRFRFAPNMSVGTTWIAKEEPFLKSNSIVSDLQFRLGVGQSGNVSGFFSPNVLAIPYVIRDVTIFYNRSDRAEALSISHPPNPSLRRELTRDLNAGVDIGLFRQRFKLQVNYYYRLHEDLVALRPVSLVSGFDRLNVNWGRMRNAGLEITLRTTNLKFESFSWETVLTTSLNRNKVLSVATVANRARAIFPSTGVLAIEGLPLNPLYSVRYSGLNERGVPLFFDEEDEERLAIDLTSNDLDVLTYHGPQDPVYDGGLTNTFSIGRSFSFSVLFVYSLGRAVRLAPIYQYTYGDIDNVSRAMVYRWRKEGDEELTKIPAILDQATIGTLAASGINSPYLFNNSDYMTTRVNFARLRNFTMSYSLPSYVVRRFKLVRQVKLEAQGQNLYFWTVRRLGNQDPEIFSGRSLYKLPLSRTFTLGIRMGI
ncbi:MAG: hypothetical protein OXB93_02270, partial [Cytophagales bacterium]|nr:hypothetical protein [Cytophagales bacterium]